MTVVVDILSELTILGKCFHIKISREFKFSSKNETIIKFQGIMYNRNQTIQEIHKDMVGVSLEHYTDQPP